MARVIVRTLTMWLVAHGLVLITAGVSIRNEEHVDSDPLVEILARITKLEEQYAELKEENIELKRLLAKADVTKYASQSNPQTNGPGHIDTAVSQQDEDRRVLRNGMISTGHLNVEEESMITLVDFNVIDRIANRQDGGADDTVRPMDAPNRIRETNNINAIPGRKLESLKLPDVNQNDHSPYTDFPVDKLQMHQGSGSAVHLLDKHDTYPLQSLSGQVKFLTEQYESLKSQLLQTSALASSKCAFSVARSKPLLGNDLGPQNVTFDFKLANRGKAFDMSSGIFTCVIPGIYYFSFTMRSFDNKTIGVTLLKNYEIQVSMFTDPSDRKVMQSQSVMLQLKVNDRVWLQLGSSEQFAIYSNTFHYITFNGIILYVTNKNDETLYF